MTHPSPGTMASGRLGPCAGLNGASALAAFDHAGQPRAQLRTRAKILLLGTGAEITLLDRRREHHCQPGYTLVAAGLEDPS